MDERIARLTHIQTLPQTHMALELTDSNFQEKVLNSSTPVLVDFWAEWCGPCRMVAPILEELSKELQGQVVIGKVDVDANANTSAQYGIRNIPTMLLFKDGKVVDKLVGAMPKHMIEAKLKEHMPA